MALPLTTNCWNACHKQNFSEAHRGLAWCLHENRLDGVLDVAVGRSTQQFPQTSLRQLCWILLLLVCALQWRWRAAAIIKYVSCTASKWPQDGNLNKQKLHCGSEEHWTTEFTIIKGGGGRVWMRTRCVPQSTSQTSPISKCSDSGILMYDKAAVPMWLEQF